MADRRTNIENETAAPKPVDGGTETDAEPGAPTVAEIGGPKGPEPTRYGDWEKKGRCIDF